MNEIIKPFEEKMQKSLGTLNEEYASIRAGRANPRLLDKIKVDYYGQPSGLQAVANISIPEARIIQIQPWDSKMIKEIERAILTSDLGINPGNDGRVIRLVFPELTEERRKDLVKDAKKKAENAKVAVRNIRREANELIKKKQKASEISEDTEVELEEDIQKMTDKYITEVDKALDEKSKEILTV